MPRPTSSISVLRATQVAVATGAFLTVLAILAVLAFMAVTDMRQEADEIDDARAVHAARAAIRSFQARLGATARDNAIWDDAYAEIPSANGANWAYDNWGKVTADYPLYDISIVFTPDRNVLSAYRKGAEFQAVDYFGNGILRLVSRVSSSEPHAASAFLSTADGIYLVAANGIEPFTVKVADGERYTLVYAKLLTPDVIRQIGETFNIAGLDITAVPKSDRLATPLLGPDGRPIHYFEWPSREPGEEIYGAVRGYVIAAGAVLIVFFVAIGIAGYVIGRRLHRDATEASHRASHDALTGLTNRSGLIEHLDAMASGKALALIDLDGFKEVNDAWGHAVGDELIRKVAGRLREAVPDARLIARLGGDEFALLVDPPALPGKAADVLKSMTEPFFIGGRTIEVGASIGGSLVEDGTIDALELLRRADMALYQAKESGRGTFVAYSRDLDIDRESRARLEDQLKHALAAGEVQPVFQPLVDAKTGKVRGVEALARWRSEAGPISPEIFIPVAERAGLIDQLGRTMLEMSIDAASNWTDVGISVNVSPIQLRNPLFAADVEQLLGERGFDPRRLTIEITEGVLMTNPEQAKRSIKALKQIGVKFALDDFGCGYASIGALREFGFDRMKIDRSLVEGLSDSRGAGILAATLSLANALGIPVTAEGVETSEQAEALISSGCDLLQGFLLGRPMDRLQFDSLISRQAA